LKEDPFFIDAVCCYDNTIGLTRDGTCYASGCNVRDHVGIGETENYSGFRRVFTSIERTIVKISAGYFHTCIWTGIL
jgi:alpha-tubulin suppressor-like RCC1 family protein